MHTNWLYSLDSVLKHKKINNLTRIKLKHGTNKRPPQKRHIHTHEIKLLLKPITKKVKFRDLKGGIKSSFQRLRLFLCYYSTIVALKKAFFHAISLLVDLMVTYISTDISRSLSCFVKEITTTMVGC